MTENDTPKEGRTTAAAAVYTRLRGDIVRGTLMPSLRLRVNDIAERYGCGPIPMREALNRLSAEHLVVHSAQRGFTVAPISSEDLMDLVRARSMMVEVATREAVKKGDVAWEERVLVAYHRLTKIPRYLSVEPRVPNPAYEKDHREFHSALISGCGSLWMVKECDRLFDHAERYRNLSRRLTVAPREDEHRNILTAALGRRVEEAVALSKRHVELTAEIILAPPADSSPPVMD